MPFYLERYSVFTKAASTFLEQFQRDIQYIAGDDLLTPDAFPDVYHFAAVEPESLRSDVNADGR